jgi:hypothetical protein
MEAIRGGATGRINWLVRSSSASLLSLFRIGLLSAACWRCLCKRFSIQDSRLYLIAVSKPRLQLVLGEWKNWRVLLLKCWRAGLRRSRGWVPITEANVLNTPTVMAGIRITMTESGQPVHYWWNIVCWTMTTNRTLVTTRSFCSVSRTATMLTSDRLIMSARWHHARSFFKRLIFQFVGLAVA